MSYQTYTTEAIVCGSFDRLTADRSYLLFTEQAGMLFATARSAREERSKQRFALQDFAHIKVSLVKGKGGWRIGSVEPLQNFYLAATTRAARGTVVAVTQLLRRLLTGEDQNLAVFSDTLTFLNATATLSPAQLLIALDTFRLRTLANLGYVASQQSYQAFLADHDDWVYNTATLPNSVAAAIEHGLAASQL